MSNDLDLDGVSGWYIGSMVLWYTSGTLLTVDATRLLSLRPAYLLRCEENSESSPRAGCTDIITSLERYAILATV